MIKIKILKESRQLLNEVSFEEAKKTLDGSKFNKKLLNIIPKVKELGETDDDETILKNLKTSLEHTIPNDITDNSKGLALLWLKQKLLDNVEMYLSFGKFETSRLIESFFQYNGSQQMPNFINPTEKKDLNKVESLYELEKLINDAKPRYKKYLEDQKNKDAEKGTEKIYDGPKWTINIAHNKGAACELGKGTEWCTAAPGLDYFAHYSKEDDPLFIFINKENPNEKYQFHYGSGQFMDKDDVSIHREPIYQELDSLLRTVPGIQKRYPKIGIKIGDKMVKRVKHGNTTDFYVDGAIRMTVVDNGDIIHFNRSGQRHRENGPAKYNKFEYQKDPENAEQSWYLEDEHHRIGGPAVINDKGTKIFVIRGERVNIDPKYKYGGPTAIKLNGEEVWQAGFSEGYKTEEEFNKYVEDTLEKYPKEDLERRSLEKYLENLKNFRKMYLNKGFSALKENKKRVIKITLRN